MDILYRQGTFSGLSLEKCHELFSDVCKIVASSNCTLLATVIRKNNVYEHKKASFDPLEWGHRLLFERACNLLAKTNQARELAKQPIENGILLIDAVEKKHDAKLRAKLAGFYRQGSMFVKNKFLIEEPLFVSSQYRNLSQLADHVAFVVRRYYRQTPKPNPVDALCKEEFNRISIRFDRSPTGVLLGCGIKLFP